MKRVRILVGAATVAASWLFIGVFQDREFSTMYLFAKHRPSFKIFFWAPLGESDRRIENLPSSLQKEERAFEEFVWLGGGYNRGIRLW